MVWRARAVPILLLLAATPVRAEDTFSGVERVVAVGDVHGDFDGFVEVLRSAGVVDKKNKWIAGGTHLVQTGDLLDRGPDSRKAMELLIALEKQARKAGGRVHALIGNHEAMNIYGDLRYTDPGEFAAFRTGDSGQVRQAYWDETLKTLPSKPDSAFKKQWEAEHPLGWVEHRIQFSSQGTYGKWILTHNVAVKINDTLYLHGGISPKYASMNIGAINAAVLAELKDLSKLQDGDFLTGDDGPLWYRGLAQDDAAAIGPLVDQLLVTHGVKRIVIGHTPTAGAVLPRLDGRIVAIDAGMAPVFGSRRACLVLEADHLYAIHRGTKLDLPTDSGADYLRYLKQASALDPQPSPLEALAADFSKALVPISPN